MPKNKIVYLIIGAILLIVGFLFFMSKEPNSVQPNPIDDRLVVNDTLKEVNLCGEIYKVKQVFIDEVDVVQRIAEIITEMRVESQEKEQLALAICENMKSGITTGNSNELEISGPAIRNNDNSKYYLGVGRFVIFTINYPSLQIEVSKAEEGSFIVIGVLK